MNPPILPWHREAANDITPHAWDWDDVDIAAIIARHDPHAAQQQETVRLLEGAEPWVSRCEMKLATQIRAHLAALRGKGETT